LYGNCVFLSVSGNQSYSLSGWSRALWAAQQPSVHITFFPFVAVIGLIFDALEKVSKRSAVIVKVEKNSLNAYTLDNRHSAFILGGFSDSMHFIANAKALEENFNALLRKHAANTTKLMPAPFGIIKASLNLVSEIEQECLAKTAERAGAVKAVVVDSGASDKDVQKAIESN